MHIRLLWSKYGLVNRRPPFAGLLAALCLIALLGAQVFGSMRGYVCDCSGTVEWTAQDHCVGPHGSDCHRNGHSEGPGNEGDRKDHEQLRDDVQVRLLPALQAPAHVPVLVAVLTELLPISLPGELPAASAVAGEDMGPPPGLTVARTVVLLI